MNTHYSNKDFLGKQKKRFSLDGQKFFITLSRNDTTKEDAMDRLKELFKDNLEYAIVSREIHKADNIDITLNKSQYHLHIIFKTLNRYKANKQDCWDIIGGHGEYEAVRCEEYAIKYVIKDGDYIAYNIDTSKYLQLKTKKTPIKPAKGIFKQITDNIDINTEYRDILIKYPDICLQHGRRIKDYIRDYREAHRPRYRDWEMNVSYFYGKSKTGKSQEAHIGYNPDTHYKLGRPQGGHIWFDGYTGQETIIIDDFSHRDYSLTYMLELLDRYAMPVQYKGGTTQMLAKNIIITSNYSPETLYRGVDNPEHRNAFLRRIHRFKHFISLEDTTQNIEYKNIEDINNTQRIHTTEEEGYTTDTDTEDIEDTFQITMNTKTNNTLENTNEAKQIRPYRCHICGDTFISHTRLNIHNRIHKEDTKNTKTTDIIEYTTHTDKDYNGNIIAPDYPPDWHVVMSGSHREL